VEAYRYQRLLIEREGELSIL